MGNRHSQDVTPQERLRTNLQEFPAQRVGVFRVSLNIITDEDIFLWGAYHQLPDHVAHILMMQGFRNVSELCQLDAEDVRTWFQAPDMLSDDDCAALEAALATVRASLLATQEDLPVSFSEDASSEFTTHHGDTSSRELPQGMDLEQDVTHGAVGSWADRRAPGYPSKPGNDDFPDNYDAEEFEYINASLAAAGIREDIFSWGAYHQLPDRVARILRMQGFSYVSELYQLDAEDVRTWFRAPDMLSDDECAALEAVLATVRTSLLATQEDLPVSFSEDASSEFTTHHGDTSSRELPQGMDLEQDVTHSAVSSWADRRAPGYPSEPENDDFPDNYDAEEFEYINASLAAAGIREDIFLWGAYHQLPDRVARILRMQGFSYVSELYQLDAEDVRTWFRAPDMLSDDECAALEAVLATVRTSLLATQEDLPVSFSEDASSEFTTHHGDTSSRELPQGMDLEEDVTHGAVGSWADRRAPDHLSEPGNDDFGDTNDAEETEYINALLAAADTPLEYCSPVPSHSAAVEVRGDDDVAASTCGGEQDTVCFLLAGKTGCGKSTTGNTILGQNLFNVAPDFGSVTEECERHVTLNRNTRIEIMDSPGLYDINKSHEEICTIIVQAVAGMHPGPHAILYVIKVGRFTPEEYAAYGRLKALFDDSITRHIILLFTHGDQLEREGKTLQELIESPNTPDSLREVFEECGHRCVLFNNMASDTQSQVDALLRQVQILVHSNGGKPYTCPKYSKIGEGLEEEVNKRMEAFEKKDLQRQKYVQELERQTKDAETAAELAFREFEELEQQRQMEERQRERQREEKERELQKQLSQQKHNTQEQRREVEQLKKDLKRQKAEQDRLRREHEKERQRERKERDRTYQAIERGRQRMREEERRRDRARAEEMERLRAAIVQNQEQEFLSKAVDFIANAIRLVLLFL